MRGVMLVTTAGLVLAGCGEKAPVLPDDPVQRAATCGVVAAATERGAAGAKGDLPVEAQERIFHYALLAGSEGGTFDSARANAVSQAMPGLFDTTIKGKWQALQPACAQAYPATKIAAPALPQSKYEGLSQCYALVDFTRKALASAGASYAEDNVMLGAYAAKLDGKLSPMLKAQGVTAMDKVQDKRNEALAKAAKLGPPPAVLKACQEKFSD